MNFVMVTLRVFFLKVKDMECETFTDEFSCDCFHNMENWILIDFPDLEAPL
jgi:hypothetical protein